MIRALFDFIVHARSDRKLIDQWRAKPWEFDPIVFAPVKTATIAEAYALNRQSCIDFTMLFYPAVINIAESGKEPGRG